MKAMKKAEAARGMNEQMSGDQTERVEAGDYFTVEDIDVGFAKLRDWLEDCADSDNDGG